MKYTEFVKANYDKVANLPAKQRMAKLGQMWKASGHSSGKGVVGGSEGGMFIKRKGRKGVKKARGKGILSDTLGAFGLGVEPQAKGGRMRRVRGKGILSDTLGAFGLGMPESGGDIAGGDAQGSGILSDTLGAFGLGMKKRGRPAKGKGVAGGSLGAVHNDVASLGKGAGIFSGVLGALGLGMPNKVKQKHYNRMVALDKQLHSKGKLTPVQHNKLKVYHTLHGAGFFDSLFSGIKKGVSSVVSAVPKAISTVGQVAKIVPDIAKYVPAAAKLVPAIGKLAAPLAKVAPLAAMI